MARTLSLKVIQRRIRELQVEADRLTSRKAGMKQLGALLRKFNLGLPDVRVVLDGSARRRSKLKGRKVKPKYRNPDNRSETWTGRGRMPVWMTAMVRKGKKPVDFLIKLA
jgi:DNA-binding protein H-NS